MKSKRLVLSDIFSNLELVGFVLLIIFLSAVLFPKNLEEILLNEEDVNVNLAITYLLALEKVTNDPLVHLKLAIEFSKKGDLNSALKELNRANLALVPEKYRKRALLLQLNLYKSMFFIAEEENERKEILSYLRRTLYYLLNLKQLNERELLELYKVSESFNLPDVGLKIALMLAKKDLNWKKLAIKKAVQLGKIDLAYSLIKSIPEDLLTEREEIWAYQIAVTKKDYSTALKYLNLMAKRRVGFKVKRWREYLVLYLKTGRISEFEGLVRFFLDKMREKKERKEVFRFAVNVFMWNGEYDKVKKLIMEYGLKLIDDPKFAIFLIKSAMATGDVKFSAWLSKLIFRKVEGC